MLQLPLRPLVPLSALALLCWSWYNFRKKSSLCGRDKEKLLFPSSAREDQSTVENVEVQDAAANENAQDVKLHCHTSQETQEVDHNLDQNCAQPGNTKMDDLSVLSEASLATILTSTPLLESVKGIRPEPEGEVSKAQVSLLMAEKPETETDDKVEGHPDTVAIKQASPVQQPTGIVCSEEHGVTNVSEKQSESVFAEADGPVEEVITAATEEIKELGGILKREGHLEQKDIELKNVPVVTKQDVGALTKTVEESVSSAHRLSDPLSGEDSGCSTCHSEDWVEAEKSSGKCQAVERMATVSVSPKSQQLVGLKNGKPPKYQADASKDSADGVQCANNDSGVTASRAVQCRNSPHTLWSIEVPAHLVGRLIGKKGKQISSIKQGSGARIYVSTLSYTHEFQICHLEGSEVQVEKALALIRKKFKELDLSNRLSSLQPADVHSLPITSWLPLPQDGTVEVIVPWVEAANYLFVQQHKHPTYYGLCSLTEQMLYCYSHSGCPSLPTPVKAGVLCAAPSPDGAWWRAQVIQHYKDSEIVQIRYVDYGGYVAVNLTSLKQIRSDFVMLPFQASEVMLENIVPLPGKGEFSSEAKAALEELTQGFSLIMKVTSSQKGLPFVHMWRNTGEEDWVP